MKNTIKKGDVLTVKDVRSGHSAKGDWSFVRFTDCEKITVWASNHDFKATSGDTVEILDIVSVATQTKKVGKQFYTNYNVTALLKNKGNTPVDFDTDDVPDFDGEGDFI